METKTACPDCDLLIELPALTAGTDLLCPRCGRLLREAHKDALQRARYLSVFGLVIYIPAMVLPLLELRLAGNVHSTGLIGAVFGLLDAGHRITATIVMAMVLIAPLLNLVVTAASSWLVSTRWRHLPWLLRINHHVRYWSMLEVFMMGVLVSVVKLRDDTEVLMGAGLLSFVCLMLITTALSWAVDEQVFWEHFDASHTGA